MSVDFQKMKLECEKGEIYNCILAHFFSTLGLEGRGWGFDIMTTGNLSDRFIVD